MNYFEGRTSLVNSILTARGLPSYVVPLLGLLKQAPSEKMGLVMRENGVGLSKGEVIAIGRSVKQNDAINYSFDSSFVIHSYC